MVIKLLPSQIPIFWEAIKFAVVSVDEVIEKDREAYLNLLLHSLLNSKSQCFVRLNEERRLSALFITRFSINKVTGEKNLSIRILYSWKRSQDEEWKDTFAVIKKFAEHEGCTDITFRSKNPRIWHLGEIMGFKESSRAFTLRMEGSQ